MAVPIRLPRPQPSQEEPSSASPVCPLCSGKVLDLGGAFRCTRCTFTWCTGCEGGPGEQFGDVAD